MSSSTPAPRSTWNIGSARPSDSSALSVTTRMRFKPEPAIVRHSDSDGSAPTKVSEVGMDSRGSRAALADTRKRLKA